VGVATALLACIAAVSPQPASATPTLDQTKAKYARIQKQVHRLDLRAEALAEKYDHAVEELRRLHREIVQTKLQLKAARISLEHHQEALGEMMVVSYKDLDPQTMALLLGAQSLSEATSSIDIKTRFDNALATAVEQIQALETQISIQEQQLVADRAEALVRKHEIEQRREQIHKELRRRRRLVRLLGARVAAGEAASKIGQEKVALAAAKWITHDRNHVANDPGAVLRDTVALEALAQIGVPYKWGGASPETGFDCSGLMMWLWAKHGVALPHFAASQYAMGPKVDLDQLQIGDLVFFHHLGHVAMYIGHGYVVHAPHTGDFVRIAKLSDGWFQATIVGATRPGPA
jgi:cell wall-associated NlpC family hydrolase